MSVRPIRRLDVDGAPLPLFHFSSASVGLPPDVVTSLAAAVHSQLSLVCLLAGSLETPRGSNVAPSAPQDGLCSRMSCRQQEALPRHAASCMVKLPTSAAEAA